jgi:2-hydroxychromene-2-carboxylate isomerase
MLVEFIFDYPSPYAYLAAPSWGVSACLSALSRSASLT